MVVHEIWSSATWIFSVVSLIVCINKFHNILYLEKQSARPLEENRPISREKKDEPLLAQVSRHKGKNTNQLETGNKNKPNDSTKEAYKQSNDPSGSKGILSDESKQPISPEIAEFNLAKVKKEPRGDDQFANKDSFYREKIEKGPRVHSAPSPAFDQDGKPYSKFTQSCCPCDPANYIKEPKDCFTLTHTIYEPEVHQRIVKNKESCVNNETGKCTHRKDENNEEQKKINEREHCIGRSCPEEISACNVCIEEEMKKNLDTILMLNKSASSVKEQEIPKQIQKDDDQKKFQKFKKESSSAKQVNIAKGIKKNSDPKLLCLSCNQPHCTCPEVHTYTSVIYSKEDPFKKYESEKIQRGQNDNLKQKESKNSNKQEKESKYTGKQSIFSLKDESKISKNLKSKVKSFNILQDHYLVENEKLIQFEKNKLQNKVINNTETNLQNTKKLELKAKSISEPFDSKIISSIHQIPSLSSHNDNCFEYSSDQNSKENLDIKMDKSSTKQPLIYSLSKSSSLTSYPSKKNSFAKYNSKTKLEKGIVNKIPNQSTKNISKRSSSYIIGSDNTSLNLNSKSIASKTSSFEVTSPKFVNILPRENPMIQKPSPTKSSIRRITTPICGAIRKKSSLLLLKMKQRSKNDQKLNSDTSKTKSTMKNPCGETRNITKRVDFVGTKYHQDRSLSLSPQRKPEQATKNYFGHHRHNRHLSFSPSRTGPKNEQIYYLNDIKKYTDLKKCKNDFTLDNSAELKPNSRNKYEIGSDFDLHDCFPQHDNCCCSLCNMRSSRDCSETDFDYSGTIWNNLDNLVRQSNWSVLLFEIKYIINCQECHLEKEALLYLYHHYIYEYIKLLDPLDAVETTILIMEALKDKTEVLDTLRELESAIRYCNQAVALIKIIQAALILENSPEHTKMFLEEAETKLNKEPQVSTRVLNRFYLIKSRYYLKLHDFDNCLLNTLKYLQSSDPKTLKAPERKRYIKSLPILSLISEMNYNQLELLKEPCLSGVVSFALLNLVESVGQGKVGDTKKLLKQISSTNQYSCISERSEIIIDKARLQAVLQVAYRNKGYISLKKAASLAEIAIERLPALIALGIKAGLYYATIQNENIFIMQCEKKKNKSTQLEVSRDENDSPDGYLESLLGPDETNII